MLVPAMLYKDEITNELKKHIYEDEMLFYSGWNGYNIPSFPDEFDGCDYRYAIIDGNKVIGYFCYTYDMHSKCLRNFGLYSFDRGNPVIGKDVLCEIKRIIKEYQPHRMEWRMVGGNPVEKHYDKFCNKYHGRKFVLTDVFKDRYGKDCAHYDKKYHQCKLHSEEPDQYYTGFIFCMQEDDFCSYGERKELDNG